MRRGREKLLLTPINLIRIDPLKTKFDFALVTKKAKLRYPVESFEVNVRISCKSHKSPPPCGGGLGGEAAMKSACCSFNYTLTPSR